MVEFLSVPPQKPIIMDESGQLVVGGSLGPLSPSHTLTLDCVVTGGKELN